MLGELMRLLSQHHDNVCVVGDEDQSIYSWRHYVADLLHVGRATLYRALAGWE